MSEPSARLLIINRERNRFQANVAKKKKKKKPLSTPGQPSAMSSLCAKLWEEEGTAGGGEGRLHPWVPAPPAGVAHKFSPFCHCGQDAAERGRSGRWV